MEIKEKSKNILINIHTQPHTHNVNDIQFIIAKNVYNLQSKKNYYILYLFLIIPYIALLKNFNEKKK